MHVRTLSAALGAAILLSAPRAQSTQIVGWADFGPRTTSELHRQDIAASSCAKAVRVCPTKIQSTTGFAGGVAYDPSRDGVWVSDGASLDLLDTTSCRLLCGGSAQRMNRSAVVSGLATYGGGERLLQLETALGYAGLRSYSVRSCPPIPLRDGCTLKIPKGAYCGGLAIDEPRGLVWVSVTLPGVLSSRNFLRAYRLSNKCQQVCEVEIPICGPPLIRSDVLGLAYDACLDRLFATYGEWTLPIQVDDPLRCKIKPLTCCAKGVAGTWRGIAVRPQASAKHYGKACVGKGCAFCQKLGARPVGGLPSLGNASFGFMLENAPLPSYGLLIVGAGRCTKGVGVPFLCGAIYPSLQSPTFFVGPVVVTGKGQCLGTATAGLPVPADKKLCGATICLEWVVICGTASGFALSDTWELVLH